MQLLDDINKTSREDSKIHAKFKAWNVSMKYFRVIFPLHLMNSWSQEEVFSTQFLPFLLKDVSEAHFMHVGKGSKKSASLDAFSDAVFMFCCVLQTIVLNSISQSLFVSPDVCWLLGWVSSLWVKTKHLQAV